MLQQAENRRDEKVEEEGHFVSLLLTRAVSAYPTFIQVGCLSLLRIEETPSVHVFVAISAPNHGAVGFIPAARTVTTGGVRVGWGGIGMSKRQEGLLGPS